MKTINKYYKSINEKTLPTLQVIGRTISNLSLKHTKRSLRRDIKWLSEIVTLRNKPIIMLYMASPWCCPNLHMFKNCNASEPFVVKIMYR